MFRVVFCLIIFLISPGLSHCSPFSNTFSTPSTDEIKIVNITPKRFSTRDLRRIREFFNGGREHCGRKCIVRNNPDTREGLYFIVNFNKPLTKLPKDVTVNIFLMLKEKLEPERFSFQLPNKRPFFVAEVHLGITSRGINQSEINAWKVELVDAKGKQLAAHKSYMWPNGV